MPKRYVRVFLISFVVLLFTAISMWIYYRYFSKRIFIDPFEYAEYNRVVFPDSKDCSTEDTIGYYFYEEIPYEERINNKFGLYIYPDNEKFIELADKLVNSNGGDWGYVLIPYNVKDKDTKKWNRVFYLLQKKHLIPVIQLWNINPDDYKKDTDNAAKFLNQFAWPIRQHYISAYNEPNDANFWYGRVDPSEYAKILNYTVESFKEENEHFFIINGAFNVSAATNGSSLDSFEFMRQMDEAVPGIFDKLDGWASHSYPQPNFSGSPYATGRWSIRAYEEELNYLEALGVEEAQDLPVFITETGWAHDVGRTYDPSFLSISKVADYFEVAFKEIWADDDRVKAVMPFSVWYDTPGDHFAWVDHRYTPYEHFQRIKALKKIAGTPEIMSIDRAKSIGCE